MLFLQHHKFLTDACALYKLCNGRAVNIGNSSPRHPYCVYFRGAFRRVRTVNLFMDLLWRRNRPQSRTFLEGRFSSASGLFITDFWNLERRLLLFIKDNNSLLSTMQKPVSSLYDCHWPLPGAQRGKYAYASWFIVRWNVLQLLPRRLHSSATEVLSGWPTR